MTNELLYLLMLLISFFAILISYKYLGKIGLIIWIVIATIVSNIQTIKLINLFGIETSLGTILYGTTFLATDIINLKYGNKEAKKTIIYGFVTMILTTLFMSITLLYIPSTNDFSNDSLTLIFTFNIRVTIASLTAFMVSQLNDAWIFNKLHKKYNKLWISNNVSTMISQLIDTVIFIAITYIGTTTFATIMQLMLTMYIFKFVISIFDTPFMYLANKIEPKEI